MSALHEIKAVEGCYLPKEQRRINEVDKLEQQIQEIVAACTHDFKLLEHIQLPTTLIEGIYNGGHETSSTPTFVLKCVRCSKEEIRGVRDTCPRCLEGMVEGRLESRRRYHGRDYSYYASRLYSCTCGFAVVVDEFDQ